MFGHPLCGFYWENVLQRFARRSGSESTPTRCGDATASGKMVFDLRPAEPDEGKGQEALASFLYFRLLGGLRVFLQRGKAVACQRGVGGRFGLCCPAPRGCKSLSGRSPVIPSSVTVVCTSGVLRNPKVAPTGIPAASNVNPSRRVSCGRGRWWSLRFRAPKDGPSVFLPVVGDFFGGTGVVARLCAASAFVDFVGNQPDALRVRR